MHKNHDILVFVNKVLLVHTCLFTYCLCNLPNGRIECLQQRPYGLQTLKIYYMACYVNRCHSLS